MTLWTDIGRASSAIAAVTGISVLCLAFFVLGVWAGALIGDFSKRIAFCSDTSSSDYIRDDAARAQSCDHPRSWPEIARDER